MLKAIGSYRDLQTAALVSTEGTMDWFCAPRFDSPSIFASLLDHRRGGHLALAPFADDCRTTQISFPGSAVLIKPLIGAALNLDAHLNGVAAGALELPVSGPMVAAS